MTRRPDSPRIHDLLAQAKAGSGNSKSAVGEAKASLALDPKNVQTMLHLADAYEKSGDFVAALTEYKAAALADGSQDLRGKFIRTDQPDPKTEYDSAQKRWDARLAALRASGKSAEADALVAKLHILDAAPSLSLQIDEAMKAGQDADKVRNFPEALADYKHAVELADKLQPHDARLVTALDKMGNNAMGQDNTVAQAAYEREYKVACELFGAQSGSAEQALQSLGRFEVFTKNYPSAEHHLFQAVEIANHNFGESSDESAKAILIASSVYMAQKDWAKAEPYVLRAVRTQQASAGKDNPYTMISLNQLCYLYDQWGKSKEADGCYQQLLPIVEKQYGKNSPVEVPILTADAKALRGMGRSTDADALEQRVAAIRAGTMTPN